MRKTVRGWKIHRHTSTTLADLAKQYNPMIRGWWEYYGEFYRTAMLKLARYIDDKLRQWARRKYKSLLQHNQRSAAWLSKMKEVCPQLFSHWLIKGGTVG